MKEWKQQHKRKDKKQEEERMNEDVIGKGWRKEDINKKNREHIHKEKDKTLEKNKKDVDYLFHGNGCKYKYSFLTKNCQR